MTFIAHMMENSELAQGTKTTLVMQAITRQNFGGDHRGKIASQWNLSRLVVAEQLKRRVYARHAPSWTTRRQLRTKLA